MKKNWYCYAAIALLALPLIANGMGTEINFQRYYLKNWKSARVRV